MMRCPKCKGYNMYIVDSRSFDTYVRRRRECANCKYRYTTFEITEGEYNGLKDQVKRVASVKKLLLQANSILKEV